MSYLPSQLILPQEMGNLMDFMSLVQQSEQNYQNTRIPGEEESLSKSEIKFVVKEPENILSF